MGNLFQDLKYGVRMLAKNPGFAAVAILTLGLGIGASATVFSWIDGVLLHPLPGVENPSQLASFEAIAPNGDFILNSYPDYIDYRDHLKTLAGLAVTQIGPMNVGEADNAEQVWGEMVSGNYFAVLGVKPALGRVFLPSEYGDTPGAYPVAVISHRLWQGRFNSDPQIVGRPIHVNRQPLTIVGVAPADFRGGVAGLAFDLWIPYMMHPQLQGVGAWMIQDRGNRRLIGIARLKPGVTMTRAQAEIAELARYMSKANTGSDLGISATVLPLWQGHFGAQTLLLKPLQILMAISVVVLLIVCANVGNLLLARFAARQKEFSMRLALGAGRFRLARQVLTESLALASGGAAIGIVMAAWMGGVLQMMVPVGHFPAALDVHLNGRILAFTILLCMTTALLSGLAPAVQAARADLSESLKEGGRSSTSGKGPQRLRGLLVVSEVALALVALVCAGLLARSFRATSSINPEFDSDHVLLARFYMTTSGYDLEQRKEFCLRLRERLESTPGVKDVAYSDVEPLGFLSASWEDLIIQGYVPAASENMKIYRSVVSPGYFRLMRILLLEGRDFTAQDELKTQPVMIVNQTFTKRYFGGRNPIGRKVHGFGQWFTVVGEVKDSKYINLTEAPTPFLYVPFQQIYRADMGLAVYVRTAASLEEAANLVRGAVKGIDPNVKVVDALPLADHISETLYAAKVAASLMSVLGMLALLLAALGLYSVMAYSVTQRTHEIGIRMALGANRKDVLKLVVGKGFALTSFGIGAGLVAALGLARLLSTFLYGVTAADPITFSAVSILLAAVVLLASYIPARRATKVDPMVALRYE
ncbi:MAG TPA: ABC transporter permease [Terriglobia bacterium]|nr:ABC transporter permease [Terriglobia bacterium]